MKALRHSTCARLKAAMPPTNRPSSSSRTSPAAESKARAPRARRAGSGHSGSADDGLSTSTPVPRAGPASPTHWQGAAARIAPARKRMLMCWCGVRRRLSWLLGSAERAAVDFTLGNTICRLNTRLLAPIRPRFPARPLALRSSAWREDPAGRRRCSLRWGNNPRGRDGGIWRCLFLSRPDRRCSRVRQ